MAPHAGAHVRLLEDQGTVDVAGITGSVLTVDLLGDAQVILLKSLSKHTPWQGIISIRSRRLNS